MDEYFREKLFATKIVLNVMRRYHAQWLPNIDEEFLNNVSENFPPSIQLSVISFLDRNKAFILEGFVLPDSLNEASFNALCIGLMNDVLPRDFAGNARLFIVVCFKLSGCARLAFERGIRTAPNFVIKVIYALAREARGVGTFSNSFWAEDIPNAAAEMSQIEEMDEDERTNTEDALFAEKMVLTVTDRHHGRPTPNYYQHIGELYYPRVRMAVLLYLEWNMPQIRDKFTEIIPLDSLNEDNFTGLCTQLANEWITSGSNARPFIEFCCNLSEYARVAQERGIQDASNITIRNICLALRRARNTGVLANDFWREGIKFASLDICESILGIPDENDTLFATNLVENVMQRHYNGWRPNYPGYPERFPDGASARFYGRVNTAMHVVLDTKGVQIQTRFAEDMLFNSLNEDNFKELSVHLVNELLACGLEARRFIEFCFTLSEYSRLAFAHEIHHAPHIAISIIFKLMSIFRGFPANFWEVDIPSACLVICVEAGRDPR